MSVQNFNSNVLQVKQKFFIPKMSLLFFFLDAFLIF